jgi:hypothetical protein
MTAILEQLRAAAPDAEIILTGSYDPDVGQFPSPTRCSAP